jgi:hypothetical protein
MQLDSKTTWWLSFALVAVQGLNSVAWATLGVDPRWIAAISQLAGYLTLLLTFAIHGSIPGVPAVQMPRPKMLLAVLVILAAGAFLFAGDAAAQTRVREIPNGPSGPVTPVAPGRAVTNPLHDLVARIRALSLADFKYAAAMADATSNKVSAACWHAWVDLLTAQQQEFKDANGQVLTEPDPHIITDIERLSELLAQLRPDSPLSISCAALASAAQKDAGVLIGGILNGGALGLFKLPIPIGPIP